MRPYNQQRLQLLRIHGQEFEEFKFILIPSEIVDKHALHVRSQAFNRTDILQELGKVLPSGFIGRWIMKDRLDVQRVNVGKASEEAGHHLGASERTPKFTFKANILRPGTTVPGLTMVSDWITSSPICSL